MNPLAVTLLLLAAIGSATPAQIAKGQVTLPPEVVEVLGALDRAGVVKNGGHKNPSPIEHPKIEFAKENFNVINSVGSSLARTTTKQAWEAPIHHWSALENYYAKLKRPAIVTHTQQVDISQVPIYVTEQRVEPEDLLFAYRKAENSSMHTLGRPTSQITQVPQLIDQAAPTTRPDHSMSCRSAAVSYWNKLPELALVQRLQQRLTHQVRSPGPWRDNLRDSELVSEESFCGKRNFLTTTKLRGSPVAYPSHVGVYNGEPSIETYLCAGIMVQERFVLTLASCTNASRLTVRLGEWADDDQTKKFVSPIEQVFVHPGYRNDTLEHNLALLKMSNPILYLSIPSVSPACQMPWRSLLNAEQCYFPARTIVLNEYFDADGDGETKVRKSVNMTELPIKLVAHDESECKKYTGIENYYFNHPYIICSADSFKYGLRKSLNQTDYFGSGIYCNEAGRLTLVSIMHPIPSMNSSSSALGYMDLSFYQPWMRYIYITHY